MQPSSTLGERSHPGREVYARAVCGAKERCGSASATCVRSPRVAVWSEGAAVLWGGAVAMAERVWCAVLVARFPDGVCRSSASGGWARAAGEVRCVQVVYVWNVNLSLFRAECALPGLRGAARRLHFWFVQSRIARVQRCRALDSGAWKFVKPHMWALVASLATA